MTDPSNLQTAIAEVPGLLAQATQVPVSDLHGLLTLRAEGTQNLQTLEVFPCETPEHEQAFSDLLTMTRDTIKRIEEQRTAITKPLLAAKAAIDALFKPAREPWERVEQVIRAKLQGAQQRRLDAEREAKRVAMLAAQASAPPQVVAAALATVPERSTPTGISSGAEWEADLVDLAQVPREWLTVDWSKVKIYLRDNKHNEAIAPVPGFTFRRKATVRAR